MQQLTIMGNRSEDRMQGCVGDAILLAMEYWQWIYVCRHTVVKQLVMLTSNDVMYRI